MSRSEFRSALVEVGVVMYQALIKPLLFRLDAERAHNLAATLIQSGWFWWPGAKCSDMAEAKLLGTNLCGLPLAHPIGLAAGFDKNGRMFPRLHRLGFSFVEVGTVTAQPQAGNSKPRLFRLPADEALINRMGFNNDGAEAVALRLEAGRSRLPLGGNIGKSKRTPLDRAFEDYAFSLGVLKRHVDYFVVNVSSPNTPDLRRLQEKGRLTELLLGLQKLNIDPVKPLLLKIDPDLEPAMLEDVVEVAVEARIAGIIATNTSIGRDGLSSPAARVEAVGAGGLSGRPLAQAATERIKFLRRRLPAGMTIVGVGGIFSGRDAFDKIMAGASCLQIYTGLIYRGPGAVRAINTELAELLGREGFTSVGEAVGQGA